MDTDFGNTASCVDPENFSQGGPRDNFDFQLGGGGGSETYFQEFYEFNKFEIFLGGGGGGGHEPPTSL